MDLSQYTATTPYKRLGGIAGGVSSATPVFENNYFIETENVTACSKYTEAGTAKTLEWKKIIWKCNKLSSAQEHQAQTLPEVVQNCDHRKQPVNKMPTLNDHTLYRIFFRSLQKLYFSSCLGCDAKIAGLHREIMELTTKQEKKLTLLKSMLGDIQMKYRKEQRKAYEKSVEKYNQLKEEYEKQEIFCTKSRNCKNSLRHFNHFLLLFQQRN